LAATRFGAFALLVGANLMWAGNWVTGRALRDAFDPVTLNFWRWVVALVALAPFGFAAMAGKWALVRRHAGILLLLALLGVVLFQCMVYLGLRTTTAINAVLLNSSLPLFVLLGSWILEREKARPMQIVGMLISLAGIVVIMTRGELGSLVHLELHSGDAWILAAMPIWGLYSILLKRTPVELRGVPFLFAISLLGTAMLAPFYGVQVATAPVHSPTALEAAGLVYVGLGASVVAFIFWNQGVLAVGANTAGFTLHLLPAFGTILAIVFLGERFALFHAVGIATILAGVVLATRK
jgi:drug/metabolite transporter (DMT)-like permease